MHGHLSGRNLRRPLPHAGIFGDGFDGDHSHPRCRQRMIFFRVPVNYRITYSDINMMLLWRGPFPGCSDQPELTISPGERRMPPPLSAHLEFPPGYLIPNPGGALWRLSQLCNKATRRKGAGASLARGARRRAAPGAIAVRPGRPGPGARTPTRHAGNSAAPRQSGTVPAMSMPACDPRRRSNTPGNPAKPPPRLVLGGEAGIA